MRALLQYGIVLEDESEIKRSLTDTFSHEDIRMKTSPMLVHMQSKVGTATLRGGPAPPEVPQLV